jgi:hypothetical protein
MTVPAAHSAADMRRKRAIVSIRSTEKRKGAQQRRNSNQPGRHFGSPHCLFQHLTHRCGRVADSGATCLSS